MNFLATGDFDNSGKLGLAVANFMELNVPILLGNGDGTFTVPTSFVYSSGNYTVSLAVGDFIGNGNLDLAVANSPTGLPIDIVLGCGDGAFNPGPVSANGNLTSAYMPAVGDFNGDGKLDIAVTGGGYTNEPVNAVTVLLGNGDGTWKVAAELLDPGGRFGLVSYFERLLSPVESRHGAGIREFCSQHRRAHGQRHGPGVRSAQSHP